MRIPKPASPAIATLLAAAGLLACAIGVEAAQSTDAAGDDRVVLGLSQYSNDGGWMVTRTAAPGAAPPTWFHLPWAAYNLTGGGLRIATGDVDGDGLDEIVVGLGSGGGGWIAVFDDAAHGYAPLKWMRLTWPAYNSANGEVWPAVGDLDGDGRDEIVAGTGPGGQGWFQIFDDATTDFAPGVWRQINWPAYTGLANAVVHPSVGNLDGAGGSEILIGMGQGSNGWLEVVNGASAGYTHQTWRQVNWTSYNLANGTTFPAVGDLDGDGRAEAVIGLGSGGGGYLEVLDDAAAGFAHLRWLRTSWSTFNTTGSGETHPAVGSVDSDLRAEIVIGLGAMPGDGGWFETLDDSVAGFVSLGWRNVEWPGFRAAGGAVFPSIGHTGTQNMPPVVNAGADQTITLPAVASLSATAIDDGLPNGTRAYSWTVVSGPAAVAFAVPNSNVTTAAFAVAGTYTLRLTVSDSVLSGSDDVTITVNPASGGGGALRELWVDKDSLGGACSDSRSAGSVTRATPYCTLWAAISHVVPGDLVHVRGGTYTESLRPITAGTSSQWIRFAAEPGEIVWLQGSADVTNGIQLFVSGGTPSFNEISGFHVRNMSHNCILVDSVPDVRLINLEATGCGIGAVELHLTQRVTLQGSWIHDNNTTGWTSAVDLFECLDGNVIRGNWISGNQDTPSGNADTEGHGITMDMCGAAGGALIENNLIWNNEGWGISIYRSDGATIRNNTSYQNGIRSGGEIMSLGNRVAIHNNILVPRGGRIALNMRYTSSGYAVDPATLQENADLIGVAAGTAAFQWGDSSGTLAQYRSGNPGGWGASSLAADPLFANAAAADFRLTAGSPARDSGDNAHAASIDIDGRPRPAGGTVDRGAFES